MSAKKDELDLALSEDSTLENGFAIGTDDKPVKRQKKQNGIQPGDNAHYLVHALFMWDWPSVDMRDDEAVRQRAQDYFGLCASNDTKPTVAGLCYAFRVEPEEVKIWRTNRSNRVSEYFWRAYQLINAVTMDYASNGKMDKVFAIFMGKNFFDMKDQQEVTVAPQQPLGEKVSGEELKKKYIDIIALEED